MIISTKIDITIIRIPVVGNAAKRGIVGAISTKSAIAVIEDRRVKRR